MIKPKPTFKAGDAATLILLSPTDNTVLLKVLDPPGSLAREVLEHAQEAILEACEEEGITVTRPHGGEARRWMG